MTTTTPEAKVPFDAQTMEPREAYLTYLAETLAIGLSQNREGEALKRLAEDFLAQRGTIQQLQTERDQLKASVAALQMNATKLANACDEVGVKYFDTDTMDPLVEAMQRETLIVRETLKQLPDAAKAHMEEVERDRAELKQLRSMHEVRCKEAADTVERLAAAEAALAKVSESNREHGDMVGIVLAGAPKTFRACGHPFPVVDSVVSDETCIYEQMYKCEICGAKEGYP
jgi:predicted RNase H-like nuclease (RuvC/YqgF family)